MTLRSSSGLDTPGERCGLSIWSRHPVARDVMVQCHWDNFNTFEHYGSGGLDMMGWDSLGSGLLPLFGFSQYDADVLHQQLVDSIPRELSSFGLSLPVPVKDFRIAVANHTAARFSDLDLALCTLASDGELEILDQRWQAATAGANPAGFLRPDHSHDSTEVSRLVEVGETLIGVETQTHPIGLHIDSNRSRNCHQPRLAGASLPVA